MKTTHLFIGRSLLQLDDARSAYRAQALRQWSRRLRRKFDTDQRSRRLRSEVSQSKAIAQDLVDHKTQGDLQEFVKDSTDDSNASVPEIQ